MSDSRSAVVLGATGAVGSSVVRALLADDAWKRVTVLVRRPDALKDFKDPRLERHVVDVLDAGQYERFLAGHGAAFCTMGLGEPSKCPREEFKKVDLDGTATFAAACRRQGVTHFLLLTAVGANARSSIYYAHIKGEVEDRVRGLGFARASFFRPSMLMTPTNRYGFTQGVFLKVFPFIDPLLVGPLSRFRSITVSDLGKAMVRHAERPGAGVEVLEWKEFQAVLRGTGA
ncbi:MAG TPA: NAD(P)H-binding protein [Gemmatimonadales bacterium]|nr:NAD(P)H-binding protein [Gemmatimonadales bacterium]